MSAGYLNLVIDKFPTCRETSRCQDLLFGRTCMTTINASRERAGGLAGVFGIVIPTIGAIVLPIWWFPPTDATGDRIHAFVAHRHGPLQAMMLCYTVGITLWLVWGAGVWSRLRSALDESSMI